MILYILVKTLQLRRLYEKASNSDLATAEEIKWLENQSGLDLTPGIVPDGYKDMRLFLWELSSNQIVLFNPGRAGYFIIETGVNQTILVNPKDKLIEIVESVPFDATSVESTVRISVASELPK